MLTFQFSIKNIFTFTIKSKKICIVFLFQYANRASVICSRIADKMDVECTMCSSYKCEDLPVICSRKSNSKSEGDLLVRSCTTKQTDQDCVNCTQKRGKCVSCTSSTNIEGDKVINSTPSTTRMEGECVICSCNTIEKCEECEVSCCKKELSTHRWAITLFSKSLIKKTTLSN